MPGPGFLDLAALGACQKLRRTNTEGVGQDGDGLHGRLALAALDATDVVAMKAGLMAESLLGVTPLSP